ncbi:MAG: hypothetical protein ACYCX3_15930 [Thermoleophilia bacterium]
MAAAALFLAHLVDFGVFHLSIYALNADRDWSLWGWAGVAAEAAAGVAAVQLAFLSTSRRVSLAILGVLVVFLSADDFLQLHERISGLGDLVPIPHASRLVWPLVYGPLLLLVAVLLWRAAAASPASLGHCLRVGVIALGVAVGLEMGSPLLFALGSDHDRWLYELEVAVEEALEFGGWTMIAGGLAGLVLCVASAAGGRRASRPTTSDLPS